jgi:hypothetical protein
MKRIIVDYQKLNEEHLTLLAIKFPDGYSNRDIVTFRNAQNELVECVEVRTEDTVYLVKISKRLVDAMEDFDLDDDDDDDDNYDDDNDNELESIEDEF